MVIKPREHLSSKKVAVATRREETVKKLRRSRYANENAPAR